MGYEKLIERLRTDSLYADKASLEIMDLCMDAATALSTLQAENKKLRARNTKLEDVVRSQRNGLQELRAEREQVKQEKSRIPEGYALVKLELLEELDNFRDLGPIDRLRELAQADREGRCVVLPCKIFDKVWDVIAHYQFEVTEIDLLPYGKIVFRCGNKGTDDYAAFYGEDLGETFVLKEPKEKNSCTESEATLRREEE